MNEQRIIKAVDEAQRFLKAVEAVDERRKTDRFTFFGCKETGALRRASLDLTRSLAEMRKSN